jgi:hypothetical protein
MATRISPNFTYFGNYLHYLQDTYSHAGFDSPIYGHALAGHKFDQPSSDLARTIRMAKSTWNALKEFSQKLGCECNSEWTPEMGNTILDFTKAPSSSTPRLNTIDSQGGIHDFFITNPPWYLEQKRLILRVPRR